MIFGVFIFKRTTWSVAASKLKRVSKGNRWLFRSADKEVKFQLRDEVDILSKGQRIAVRIVFGRQAT